MFLQNWWKKRKLRVPFLNLRYRDESIDVRLNLALIGLDDADELEETLMKLAQGFVNMIKQELDK
jgi:hypothetical protein